MKVVAVYIVNVIAANIIKIVVVNIIKAIPRIMRVNAASTMNVILLLTS